MNNYEMGDNLTMNGLNVEETFDLIKKLLELQIGDQGRLIYIKDSLEKGRIIYKTDKNYLKKMKEKIKEINIENKKSLSLTESDRIPKLKIIEKLQRAEIDNSGRLLTIKNAIIKDKEISDENHGYLNEKYDQLVKTDEYEKMVFESLEIINELKAEIGNSERLESIKTTLLKGTELQLQDIKYFNKKIHTPKKFQGYEKILSENKEKVTQPTTTDVSSVERHSTSYDLTVTLKVFDIVVWVASTSFLLWMLGLTFINLSPIHDHLLGFAVGLSICAGIIRKIQSKLKHVQP